MEEKGKEREGKRDLVVLKVVLKAHLLGGSDEDLHLRDAVSKDDVAILLELLGREAATELNDLHLLEDGALSRLSRPFVSSEASVSVTHASCALDSRLLRSESGRVAASEPEGRKERGRKALSHREEGV